MGVAARGLDHHVECALGLHTLVAHFRQCVVERMAVFVIGLKVGTQTRGASDNTLHHGRRADMAEGAGRLVFEFSVAPKYCPTPP